MTRARFMPVGSIHNAIVRLRLLLHLLRLRRRLLPGHGLARALAGASVRVGSLTAYRQISAMPEPTVGAEVHQPLDVERDLAPEVSLNLVALVEDRADTRDLVVA